MSYEQFGDDAAALLQALKVEHADVLGYSQGGGAALQLAIRPLEARQQARLARRDVLQGRLYPSVFKAIEGLNAKVFAGSPNRGGFQEDESRPEGFRGVH